MRSTKSFSIVPYLTTLLSNSLWLYYGLLRINETLLVSISALGVCFGVAYIFVYLLFASKTQRVSAARLLLLVGIVFGTISFSTLRFSHDNMRVLVVGVFCAANSACNYASPLSVLRLVIKTKSVEYMPFWLCFFLAISAGVWLAYALVIWDPFLVITLDIDQLTQHKLVTFSKGDGDQLQTIGYDEFWEEIHARSKAKAGVALQVSSLVPEDRALDDQGIAKRIYVKPGIPYSTNPIMPLVKNDNIQGLQIHRDSDGLDVLEQISNEAANVHGLDVQEEIYDEVEDSYGLFVREEAPQAEGCINVHNYNHTQVHMDDALDSPLDLECQPMVKFKEEAIQVGDPQITLDIDQMTQHKLVTFSKGDEDQLQTIGYDEFLEEIHARSKAEAYVALQVSNLVPEDRASDDQGIAKMIYDSDGLDVFEQISNEAADVHGLDVQEEIYDEVEDLYGLFVPDEAPQAEGCIKVHNYNHIQVQMDDGLDSPLDLECQPMVYVDQHIQTLQDSLPIENDLELIALLDDALREFLVPYGKDVRGLLFIGNSKQQKEVDDTELMKILNEALEDFKPTSYDLPTTFQFDDLLPSSDTCGYIERNKDMVSMFLNSKSVVGQNLLELIALLDDALREFLVPYGKDVRGLLFIGNSKQQKEVDDTELMKILDEALEDFKPTSYDLPTTFQVHMDGMDSDGFLLHAYTSHARGDDVNSISIMPEIEVTTYLL
ncbi:hypothetical protein L7F22_010092 [Adiantum nelumboides]|nr:hypothetical protein [Adiantum nelumboides]